MRRETPIAVLVHQNIFPNPRQEDPANFAAHLSKNLVGEVRIETATFYGSLDTIEARYPGLNYSHPPHRKRLGRFPHHARLFQAFDQLGLTPSEIAGFCRWEGTLWARERYERDEGIKVIDTTGQEIGPWVDHRERKPRNAQIKVKTEIEVQIAEAQAAENVEEDENMEDEQEADESDDEGVESVGFDLNNRLREAVRLREQGINAQLDPAYEQWIKDQQEREQRIAAPATVTPIIPPPQLLSPASS